MGAVTMKHHRDVFEQAKEIVEDAGGRCRLETASNRGHGKLIIEVGRKRRMTPLSASPRNRDDFVRRKLCDVRRLLREMAH